MRGMFEQRSGALWRGRRDRGHPSGATMVRPFASRPMIRRLDRLARLGAFVLAMSSACQVAAPVGPRTTLDSIEDRERFEPLTEPPCSYCSTQNRKGLIQDDDRAVAWLRGDHNGGAIPIRLFLSAPRVVNDTYGLFFFDPDAGCVAAYQKDYGYRFHGWLRGAMVAEGPDGTLWHALSGMAFAGPRQGQKLVRIPSLVTDWGYWMILHPESTTYDLFDGERYDSAAVPAKMSSEARDTMGMVDWRLSPTAEILGVEVGARTLAVPLPTAEERACIRAELAGTSFAVFWYKPTRTAVAFRDVIDGKRHTFRADAVSPETAPFQDAETGTRWTLAGRAVDGPLKGRELEWVSSIQCRWFAWVAQYPTTTVHESSP